MVKTHSVGGELSERERGRFPAHLDLQDEIQDASEEVHVYDALLRLPLSLGFIPEAYECCVTTEATFLATSKHGTDCFNNTHWKTETA